MSRHTLAPAAPPAGTQTRWCSATSTSSRPRPRTP